MVRIRLASKTFLEWVYVNKSYVQHLVSEVFDRRDKRAQRDAVPTILHIAMHVQRGRGQLREQHIFVRSVRGARGPIDPKRVVARRIRRDDAPSTVRMREHDGSGSRVNARNFEASNFLAPHQSFQRHAQLYGLLQSILR